jgi:hypothetical protein
MVMSPVTRALRVLAVSTFVLSACAPAPTSRVSTPEPYPLSGRYPAEVAVGSTDDMATLYRLRADIDALRTAAGEPARAAEAGSGLVATVYVTPAEAQALARAGLPAVPIANKSLRAAAEYGLPGKSPAGWPSFEAVVARMQAIAAAHPDIVRMVSIGQSVQGRDIWFLKITDNPDIKEDEPKFRYSSTMHGDEVVGSELVLRLAELLTNGYGTDGTATALVNGMEIWLCPLHNPDGYVAVERGNAHGQDLNRNFPDRLSDPVDTPDGREPETQAVMHLCSERRFVMGANLHCGMKLVNYPWDGVTMPGGPPATQPVLSPDDALFRELGNGYAGRNGMFMKAGLLHSVTEGWEWFQVYGGMQDWAYFWRGEHHVTIEVSSEAYPPYQQMDGFWEANREAMLWWMSRALTGIRGVVRDASTGAPLDATVSVGEMAAPNAVRTDPEVGDYHRLIAPGTYTLVASAAGHSDGVATVTVISGQASGQDFALARGR